MGASGSPGFASLLAQSAHQDPRLRAHQEQQASGWAAPVGQAAYLGGQFLEGVRQGRVQKFLMQEQQREREWNTLAQSIERRLQDPDLTDAGRAALMKEAQAVANQRFVEETKDVAKDKKSMPGMVAGILRNIAIGMSGGEMPKGSRSVDPARVLFELDDRVTNNPEYSVKASLEKAQSAWLRAVKEAADEVGGLDLVDQQIMMRKAAPILTQLAAAIGSERANEFLRQRIVGFAPSARSIAENAEARTDIGMMRSIGLLPQATSAAPPPATAPAAGAMGSQGEASGMGGAPPPTAAAPPAARTDVPPPTGPTPEQYKAAREHKFLVERGMATPLQERPVAFYVKNEPNAPGFSAREMFNRAGQRVWVSTDTGQEVTDMSKFTTDKPEVESYDPITLTDGKREITATINRKKPGGQVTFIDPKTNQKVTVEAANLSQYGLRMGQVERDPYAAQTTMLLRQERAAAGRAATGFVASTRRTRSDYITKAQGIDAGPDTPEEKKRRKAELKLEYEANAVRDYEETIAMIESLAPNLPEADRKKLYPPKPPGYLAPEERERKSKAEALKNIRGNIR